MKFARYLEENQQAEWRRAYINYRGLKKLIKRVEDRHHARVSTDLSRQATQGSVQRSVIGQTVDGLRKRQREALGAGIRNLSATSASNAAPTPNAGQRTDLPPVELAGTGLKLTLEEVSGGAHIPSAPVTPAEHDHGDDSHLDSVLASRDVEAQAASVQHPEPAHTAQHARRHVQIAEEDREARGEHGGETNVDPQASAEEHDTEGDSAASNNGARPLLHRDGPTNKKGTKRDKKRAARKAALDTLISTHFDKEEAKFFSAMDAELQRIVDFYEAREGEMVQRFELLARQMAELSEHRRAFKQLPRVPAAAAALRDQTISRIEGIVKPAAILAGRNSANNERRGSQGSPEGLQPLGDARSNSNSSGGSGLSGISGKSPLAGVQEDEGDRRRSMALARMLELGHLSPQVIEQDDKERAELRAAAESHDPERYRQARRKLKMAVLQYYRGLEILKNYKTLNRTGMAKAMKKFEKRLNVRDVAEAYYRAKVQPTSLIKSDRLEKLIASTEEVYTAYFEHGNRKKALERLRMMAGPAAGELKTHHFSAARTGFYLGIALVAAISGIVEATEPEIVIKVPAWERLLRVYGAFFVANLVALLFGMDLWIFHRNRINALFIFEWDVRTAIAYHQYFELPALFMLLLACCFWMSHLAPAWSSIAPTTWPMVWFVTVIVILLDPLNFMLRPSRTWFTRSMLRLFGGGLFTAVEFRDFFLGDVLVSLAWPLSTLYVFGCEYHHNWSSPGSCNPDRSFWTPVLLTLPSMLRLTQSIRRWLDSDRTAKLHLVNAGKYASIVLYYWLYFNWRYHGSETGRDLAVWIFFACVYTVYAGGWDLLMDWTLLRPRARYWGLRNELVYENYWPVYYWAIITNTLMRFQWIIYLLPGPASRLLRQFIIALIEALRRWQWIAFRVETEQVGNIDSYRVVRAVPLPYHIVQRRSSEDEEEDDDGDDQLMGSGDEGQKRPGARPHGSAGLHGRKGPFSFRMHKRPGSGGSGADAAAAGNQNGQPEPTAPIDRALNGENGQLEVHNGTPGAAVGTTIPQRPGRFRRMWSHLVEEAQGEGSISDVSDGDGEGDDDEFTERHVVDRGNFHRRDYAPRAAELEGAIPAPSSGPR